MTLTTTSASRRWSALALIVTAQFMVILDVAIVNVALPSIKSDLGFSATSLQWVVSAYAILFGGALLLGGRLADLVGRRRLFVIGLLVFAASSLLCGLAWSEASLIAFRALQGLGGALLAPAALVAARHLVRRRARAQPRARHLRRGVRQRRRRRRAARRRADELPELVVDLLHQRPGGDRGRAARTGPPAREPPRSRPPALRRHGCGDGHQRVDAVRLRAHRGRTTAGSAPETLSLLAASIALIGAFLVIELRSPWPLLPLRIFRSRALSTANGAMAILGAVTFSEFFVLALYLQEVLHYSAVQSGVAFVGFALTVVVVSNLAQVVVGRVGVRTTLTAGLLMSAASLAYLTRLPVDGHYFWDLFPAFVLGGAGLGLAFVPVTIASLAGVARADAGIASGLVNTSRQIGGAIGIAATTAIASSATSRFGDAPAGSAAGLDHGYQTALYVLTGLLIVGAALTGTHAPHAGRGSGGRASRPRVEPRQ